MNYELAKKLKEAGFAQEYHDCVGDGDGHCVCIGRFTKDVMIPTLSELIEACGEGFEYLNKVHGGGWVAGTKDIPRTGTLGDSQYENGTTPEEAVANLWLAINKKP